MLNKSLYIIKQTSLFKKDRKLIAKQGKNMSKLQEIVTKLANGEPLPPHNKDHKLQGDYEGCKECHIAPDWLLIYRIDKNNLILLLTRTGSHSDLF